MDNAHREKLYGPDMVFDVQVNEVENGLDIHIVNSGIDRAPLRVELAFNAGCRVENEHFMLEGNDGGGIVVKDDTVTTMKDGVFAGGDAVTGAATVIKAMGAGKKAAAAIDAYIKSK